MRSVLPIILFKMRYEQPAINFQIEDRFRKFVIEILKEYALLLTSQVLEEDPSEFLIEDELKDGF